jgi:hypothetical protein
MRAIRSGLLQQLHVVIVRRDVAVQQYVRVHIRESRQHGSLRKIDHLGSGRGRASGRDGNNLVAFDDDQRVENRRVALPVNQPPRADRNRFRRCLTFILCTIRWAKKKRPYRNNSKERTRDISPIHGLLLPQCY